MFSCEFCEIFRNTYYGEHLQTKSSGCTEIFENMVPFFSKEPVTFCRASMFLFFSTIWASSVLIPVLIHSCYNTLQFAYLTITSHLACWKSRKFPILDGKKNFSKYISIVYSKLLIDSKRLLWYIFLFLTEHNPNFTLFLICSFSLTQSELRCCFNSFMTEAVII